MVSLRVVQIIKYRLGVPVVAIESGIRVERRNSIKYGIGPPGLLEPWIQGRVGEVYCYRHIVRAGRREGDLSALAYWEEEGVGERKVYNRGAGHTHQGEPSVFLWGVEESKAGFCYFWKVWDQGAEPSRLERS